MKNNKNNNKYPSIPDSFTKWEPNKRYDIPTGNIKAEVSEHYASLYIKEAEEMTIAELVELLEEMKSSNSIKDLATPEIERTLNDIDLNRLSLTIIAIYGSYLYRKDKEYLDHASLDVENKEAYVEARERAKEDIEQVRKGIDELNSHLKIGNGKEK